MLPLEIDIGIRKNLRLVAVWASNRRKDFRPLADALEGWDGWLAGGPVIVAGDFNHHRKWDTKRHPNGNRQNHQFIESLLHERHNLVFAYHYSRGVEQGDPAEEPTFWMAYDPAKAHHIDYVYAPRPCVSTGPEVAQIGTWGEYASPDHRLSDHAPLVCEIDDPSTGLIIGDTFDPVRGPLRIYPYDYREPSRQA